MPSTTNNILIVEDDHNTAELIATYLEREGFVPHLAHDGEQGLKTARQLQPLLVVLDVMLPELDGFEICRRLRAESEVPILFLTAREEEIDRVLGFSLGADDYVVKPFSPRELVERVKAILRRSRAADRQSDNGILRLADLTLDPEKHKVTRSGQDVRLTGSEYLLLQALMSAPGRVFSREELLDRFYPDGEAVIDRVIDVHINKLRQKLERDSAHPVYIETVRGFGYRFAEQDPE